MWVRGGGLLDDAAGVYGPDGVIFILEILITCSKLRFCVGFGGGAGFLDSTVGIDQIASTVQISRNQTQVGISLLTESVNVEGVILDAVIPLSLFGAVGVEVPVMGIEQVLVIYCQLPGFHSAVYAEI